MGFGIFGFGLGSGIFGFVNLGLGLGSGILGFGILGLGLGSGILGFGILGWHWPGQAHTRPKPCQARGKPSQAMQATEISRKYPAPFGDQFACTFAVKKLYFLQFGTNWSKS